MLGPMNLPKPRRSGLARGREAVVKPAHDERKAEEAKERRVVSEPLRTRSADEWEVFFQTRHIPAGRVRRLEETLVDPHLDHRAVLHSHAAAPDVGGAFTVPVAAFKLAHGSARIDSPPPVLGQNTDEVLRELGYAEAEIAELRAGGVI